MIIEGEFHILYSTVGLRVKFRRDDIYRPSFYRHPPRHRRVMTYSVSSVLLPPTRVIDERISHTWYSSSLEDWTARQISSDDIYRPSFYRISYILKKYVSKTQKKRTLLRVKFGASDNVYRPSFYRLSRLMLRLLLISVTM